MKSSFSTIVFVVIVIGLMVFGYSVGKNNKTSENDQTLNAYATFESSCSNRGYDRDDCLLIWSGR